MATTKEFREFFLRDVPVLLGLKKDQEMGYPTTYIVNTPTGTKSVKNRFLKDHYPSEGVFRKFMESIAFKLNPEDTASLTIQGLAKIAADADVKSNAGGYIDLITRLVQPYQVPTVRQEPNITIDLNTIINGAGSVPTQLIEVGVDGGISTRNEYTVKVSEGLVNTFYGLLGVIRNYVNSGYVSINLFTGFANSASLDVVQSVFGGDNYHAVQNVFSLGLIGESIKRVGDVGSMSNGAAIPPNANPMYIYNDSQFYLNVDAINRVHLEGHFHLDLQSIYTDGVTDLVLVDLPVGYRKEVKNIPVIITDKDDAGGSDSAATCYINSGGQLRLRLPAAWGGGSIGKIGFYYSYIPTF